METRVSSSVRRRTLRGCLDRVGVHRRRHLRRRGRVRARRPAHPPRLQRLSCSPLPRARPPRPRPPRSSPLRARRGVDRQPLLVSHVRHRDCDIAPPSAPPRPVPRSPPATKTTTPSCGSVVSEPCVACGDEEEIGGYDVRLPPKPSAQASTETERPLDRDRTDTLDLDDGRDALSSDVSQGVGRWVCDPERLIGDPRNDPRGRRAAIRPPARTPILRGVPLPWSARTSRVRPQASRSSARWRSGTGASCTRTTRRLTPRDRRPETARESSPGYDFAPASRSSRVRVAQTPARRSARRSGTRLRLRTRSRRFRRRPRPPRP